MKKTWIGLLAWEKYRTFGGDDESDLMLFTKDDTYRARGLVDQFAGRTVKITIEVLEDEEDVAL